MSKRLPAVGVPAPRMYYPSWDQMPVLPGSVHLRPQSLTHEQRDDSLIGGGLRAMTKAEILEQRKQEAQSRRKIAESALPVYSRRTPDVSFENMHDSDAILEF